MKEMNLKTKGMILLLLAVIIVFSAVGVSFALLKEETSVLENDFRAAIEYNLHYNLSGGTGSIADDNYVGTADETEHTFTITEQEPAKEGYIFLGWASTNNAEQAEYHANDRYPMTSAAPSKNLYAVWQEEVVLGEDHRLNFVPNVPYGITGANVTVPGTMTEKAPAGQECVFTLSVPAVDSNAANTGLVFLGWSASPYSDTPEYPHNSVNPATFSTTETDNTLYAIWDIEYYVSFYSGVTDGSVYKVKRSDDSIVDNTDPILVSTLSTTPSIAGLYESADEEFRKDNYVNVGFSATLGGVELSALQLTQPGRNNAKAVYLRWNTGTYALHYDANGGSNAPATQTANSTARRYTFTISTSVPSPIAGSGASFLGWARTPDATEAEFKYSGERITPSSITVNQEDEVCTLYAVWQYTYTLSYHQGHGAENSPLPATATYTTTSKSHAFTVDGSVEPERSDDFVFMYYSVTKDWASGEPHYRGDSIGNYAKTITVYANNPNVTLYARFRYLESFKLKYDANTPAGANGSVSGVPGEDSDISLDEVYVQFSIATKVPVFNRTDNSRYVMGYEFDSWNDKPDGTGNRYLPGEKIDVASNETVEKTLYAIWTPYDEFIITTNYNGGEVTRSVSSCETGTSRDPYEWPAQYFPQSSASFTLNCTDTYDALRIGYPYIQPTRTNYNLQGFSYYSNNTRASYKKPLASNVLSGTYNRANEGQYESLDISDNSYGSSTYRLTIYAVWKLQDAKDIYRVYIYKNAGDGSSVSDYAEVKVTQPTSEDEEPPTSASVRFDGNVLKKNDSDATWERFGYKLLGFAYTETAGEGDIVNYVTSDGKGLETAVMVDQASPYVSTSAGSGESGGDLYVLRMYGVWEKHQFFEVRLHAGPGENAVSLCPQREVREDVTSVTFNGLSTVTWPGHELLGYSFTEGATEPDIPASELSTYQMVVDKAVHESEVSDTGHTYTWVDLYAVWQEQEYFQVFFEHESATYPATTGLTVPLGTTSQEIEVTIPTASRMSYSVNYKKYSGYSLIENAESGMYEPGKTYTITVEKGSYGVTSETNSDGTLVTTLTLYPSFMPQAVFTVSYGNHGESHSKSSSQMDTPDAYTMSRIPTVFSGDVSQMDGYKLMGFITATTANNNPAMYKRGSVKGWSHGYYMAQSDPTGTSGFMPVDSSGYFSVDFNFSDPEVNVSTATNAYTKYTMVVYPVYKQCKVFTFSVELDSDASWYSSYSNVFYNKYTYVYGFDNPSSAAVSGYAGASLTNGKGAANKAGYTIVGLTRSVGSKVAYGSSNYTSTAFNVSNINVIEGESGVTSTTNADGITTVSLKLYPIWGLVLYYSNPGAAVVNANPEQTGRQIDLSASILPTKDSWTFMGWDTSSAGSDAYYGVAGTYTSTKPQPLLETVTYDSNTAVFTLHPSFKQKLILYYNVNGGNTEDTPAMSLSYNSSGSRFFDVSSEIPRRDGYTFLGWADTASATVAQYGHTGSLSTEVLVTGKSNGAETTKTIYAVWQENAAAANAAAASQPPTGDAPPADDDVIVDDDVVADDDVIADDKSAAGDKPAADSSAASPAPAAAPPIGQKFVLKYNINGGLELGAPTPEEKHSSEGSAVFSITSVIPVRDGYTFLGWAEAADAAAPAYAYGSETLSSQLTVQGNADGSETVITLYAVWQAIPAEDEQQQNEPKEPPEDEQQQNEPKEPPEDEGMNADLPESVNDTTEDDIPAELVPGSEKPAEPAPASVVTAVGEETSEGLSPAPTEPGQTPPAGTTIPSDEEADAEAEQ